MVLTRSKQTRGCTDKESPTLASKGIAYSEGESQTLGPTGWWLRSIVIGLARSLALSQGDESLEVFRCAHSHSTLRRKASAKATFSAAGCLWEGTYSHCKRSRGVWPQATQASPQPLVPWAMDARSSACWTLKASICLAFLASLLCKELWCTTSN